MKNPLEITIVVSVPQSGGNFQRNNLILENIGGDAVRRKVAVPYPDILLVYL
jgi:hypothetical protein